MANQSWTWSPHCSNTWATFFWVWTFFRETNFWTKISTKNFAFLFSLAFTVRRFKVEQVLLEVMPFASFLSVKIICRFEFAKFRRTLLERVSHHVPHVCWKSQNWTGRFENDSRLRIKHAQWSTKYFQNSGSYYKRSTHKRHFSNYFWRDVKVPVWIFTT